MTPVGSDRGPRPQTKKRQSPTSPYSVGHTSYVPGHSDSDEYPDLSPCQGTEGPGTMFGVGTFGTEDTGRGHGRKKDDSVPVPGAVQGLRRVRLLPVPPGRLPKVFSPSGSPSRG